MTRERVVYELENSIKLGISISREAREWLLVYLEQEPTTKNNSKFCPDRKAKTTHMETILHCIENECAAYKDGKCLKYNSEQEPTPKYDVTENCIVCKYDETEDENGDHCKKCLAGNSQFEPDDAFIDDFHADDIPTITITIEEYMKLRECEDKCKAVVEPTTKNDLGVDCISRADAIKGLGEQPYVWTDSDYEIQQLEDWKAHKEMLENLPSATPQEPRKITLEDVEGYCKPRCLTIISNELLYELTHPKIKALEQEPIRSKGKWISYHYGAYYECSNCRERNNSRYDKYCKFCGAKMEQQGENT